MVLVVVRIAVQEAQEPWEPQPWYHVWWVATEWFCGADLDPVNGRVKSKGRAPRGPNDG